MGQKRKAIWDEARQEMVSILRGNGAIQDEAVLGAMAKVPRHRMIPGQLGTSAYRDKAMSIALQQTISQPSIVAHMTQALELTKDQRVLEIGTGSGYQTAVLAEIVKKVFSIEILAALSYDAQDLLFELGYDNIHYKVGDGFEGWPAFMPFDAILIACASPTIPEPLISQLREGGKLVMPLGSYNQELIRITMIKGQPKYEKLNSTHRSKAL